MKITVSITVPHPHTPGHLINVQRVFDPDKIENCNQTLGGIVAVLKKELQEELEEENSKSACNLKPGDKVSIVSGNYDGKTGTLEGFIVGHRQRLMVNVNIGGKLIPCFYRQLKTSN